MVARLVGLLRLVGIACVALVLLGASEASAQIEAPQGNIGVFGQVAQNTGAAGDAYRLAWLAGVNAGYEVGSVENVGVGAVWSMAWGLYQAPAEMRADDSVRVLEMSFGLRIRRHLGRSTPRFLVADSGATILRLNRALPPDNERLYLGPYAALGLDQYVGAGVMVSFAIRYGLIAGGPASLGLRLGISLGS